MPNANHIQVPQPHSERCRFSYSGDVIFNQPVALCHSKGKAYREREQKHEKKVERSQNYKNTHFRTGARGTLQTIMWSCTKEYSTNWEKINQWAHPTLDYIMAKGRFQLIKKVHKLRNMKKLRELRTAIPWKEKTRGVVMTTFKNTWKLMMFKKKQTCSILQRLELDPSGSRDMEADFRYKQWRTFHPEMVNKAAAWLAMWAASWCTHALPREP